MKGIYLDYAASTPLDRKVLREMVPFLKKEFGNPSSLHSSGQKARAAIEKARERAARFLNCKPLEVVFTSGATEANNLAIRGVIQDTKPHIVTTQIEHESVLAPCQRLAEEGLAEVTYVGVDKEGIVKIEEIEKAIKKNTVLVSVMYANSEIGTVQPIAEIGALLSKYKILLHTDAAQAAQFLDCDVKKLGVDLLTLSSHKFYGPKGAGALYAREGASIRPLLNGGGQEQGLRSGTENVAAIVGMGAALEEIRNPKSAIRNIQIRQLRDKLMKAVLARIPKSFFTGSLKKRLPNNAHFRFEGLNGKDLVMVLDQKGIAVSTGSACSEKTEEPSHVLLALGFSREEAFSCVRLSIGKGTTKEEIERALKTLVAAVGKLRAHKV